MRVLHTADWHLGHAWFDLPRAYEHERFLAWLLDQIEQERVDALIVSGDIFDTANPSATAQRAWFEFLGRARARRPTLDIVAVAGNHDSGARLSAPAPILEAFGVHLVGALPRRADGSLDVSRLILPLHDDAGRVGALVAAVPYLRPGDLRRRPLELEGDADSADSGDPIIEGVREVYSEGVAAALARRSPDQALLVTGHCYMTGGKLSDLSERKILGGNQHALPVDIFGDEVTYAALGHLHLAQKVGDRRNVRYAGSPIPLAIDEERYPHQVCLVELKGAELHEVRSLRVPRVVDILRIPDEGFAPLDEALCALRALPPLDHTVAFETRPYLEVRVSVENPRGVRSEVAAALEGRHPRLVSLRVDTPRRRGALADGERAKTLVDLSPEDVLRRCFEQSGREGELSAALLEAYHELVELATREDR